MVRRFCLMLSVLLLPWVATAAPAQRVISLAPNLTELAFAAGLGDKLVGVSAYSDYPPQAAKIEQVANWQGINTERIVTLKPDLVLAWRGHHGPHVVAGVRVVVLVHRCPHVCGSDAKSVDAAGTALRHPRGGGLDAQWCGVSSWCSAVLAARRVADQNGRLRGLHLHQRRQHRVDRTAGHNQHQHTRC